MSAANQVRSQLRKTFLRESEVGRAASALLDDYDRHERALDRIARTSCLCVESSDECASCVARKALRWKMQPTSHNAG